jgi:serine/threonine protein kinase
MTAITTNTHDPVDRLAEDFLKRFRQGERPSVTEYAKQFPDVADQVAEVIQVLLLMENLGAEQDNSSDQSAEPIPEQLGEYRIVREIGRGGMGVVYEAIQGELGRHVALKVLPAHALLKPTHLTRFRREAQAVARLHHTNIVPVFGVGAQDGTHYYAMQYIQGQGLDAVLKEVRQQRKQTDSKETLQHALGMTPHSTISGYSNGHDYSVAVGRIGAQIAEALAHAHAQGILHRDIKPSNILLDHEGRAWLSDFGLAQIDTGEALTGTGDVVGTLRYMAPERFQRNGDARTDTYALGLTLYELLTLGPAFQESDRARLIHQILKEEPPLPRRLQPTVPRDLETIILKAITKEPEKRYQTADELADDLKRFLADRPVAARRLRWWERWGRWVSRNTALSIVATLAFTALLAGLATTFWQWRRAETNAIEKVALAQKETEQKLAAEKNAAFAWRMLYSILNSVNNGNAMTTEQLRRSVYDQAFKIHKEYLSTVSEPPRSYEMGRIALELGSMLNKSGEETQAREYYRQAIAAIQESLQSEPGNLEARTDLALGWGFLARNLAEADDPGALAAVQNSITMFKTLAVEAPNDKQFLIRQVHNLETLARIRKKSAEEWETPLREAKEIIQRFNALVKQPSGLELFTLINLHRTYANYLEGDRRLKEALTEANTAHQYSVRLTRLYPESDTYLAQFSVCSSTLGSIYQSLKDYPQAEALHRQEIEVLRGLIQRDPNHSTQLHSTLGAALNNLALVLSKQGHVKGALEVVDEAISEQRLALQKNPNHARYLQFLCTHFKNQAAFYVQDHDHVKATETAKQIATIKIGKGTNHYECAYYLCKAAVEIERDQALLVEERAAKMKSNFDLAMAELQTAVQNGYADKNKLQSVSFVALKSRPEYQKLLVELLEKSSKSR